MVKRRTLQREKKSERAIAFEAIAEYLADTACLDTLKQFEGKDPVITDEYVDEFAIELLRRFRVR